jgi:hypothetical protein
MPRIMGSQAAFKEMLFPRPFISIALSLFNIQTIRTVFEILFALKNDIQFPKIGYPNPNTPFYLIILNRPKVEVKIFIYKF